MVRKLVALLLCLMLAVPTAYAAESPLEKVHGEWRTILETQNTLFGIQSWAIAQTAKYLETHTWQDLLLARVAASSACVYLEQSFTLPQATLTRQDYDDLLEQVDDMDFVNKIFKGLASDYYGALLSMTHLMQMLEYEVFWQPDEDHLIRWVELEQKSLEVDYRMAAMNTNALILSSQPDEQAAEAASYIEAFPAIFAGYTQWAKDDRTLEGWMADEITILEGLEAASAELPGMQEASLIILEAVYESGNLDALKNNAVAITGLPGLMPEPFWDKPEVTSELYPQLDYYHVVDGENYYYAPTEPLKPCAVTTRMVWDDVSREDFDLYIDDLVYYGIPTLEEESTADSREVYLLVGDSLVAFIWGEDFTFMLAPDPTVCFVPFWYMP